MTEQLHSPEAERAVLGACMLSPHAIEKSELVESDFRVEAHRLIWRVITTLHAERQPIDPVTVDDRLSAWGESESTGGLAYVGQLAGDIISAANVAGHARIVRDHSIRRSLIASATTLSHAAFDRSRSLTDVIDETQRSVLELSTTTRESTLAPLSAYVAEFLDDTQNRFESGGMVGIPTGHDNVDKLLCGLEGGDLVVVAGRPSMGKSMLAAQWAEHSAQQGGTVAFFSLEMPIIQLMRRSAARFGKIGFDKLRSGNLAQDEFARLNAAVSRFKDLPIHIDDTPGLAFSELRARARRIHHKSPLSLIVVDYLQIVDPGEMAGKDARQDIRIGAVSTGLKNLAKELNCPVIAVAQLNRGVDGRSDKRPQMSDLREAGQLEQDADVIAFIYREEAYTKDSALTGLAEVIIRKQRNGPAGTAYLTFLGQYQRFEDADDATVTRALNAERERQTPKRKSRGMDTV